MFNPQPQANLSQSSQSADTRSSSLKQLPQNKAQRDWLAQLRLTFGARQEKTILLENTHCGPLSVQRPFYPEDNGCCHTYLLHPPGGMAPGDRVHFDIAVNQHSHALLTTPAAGKIYRTDTAKHLQQQLLHADIGDQACLEWLPQETIVFTGANARIHNRFCLRGNAKLIAWDIVCLGRRASNELFDQGHCEQLIEVEDNGRLVLRERNLWSGGAALMSAPWGMANYSVAGTLMATFTSNRHQLDDWRHHLTSADIAGEWGITQKSSLFIARYLGQSAQACRRGFELLWQHLRPAMLKYSHCRPRIWNT